MLTYEMDRRGGKTKTLYLYECIKEDIITGKLLPGEKLPSKRELAEHLGISVLTIENAYIMLEEEGYINAKPKVGFYVNQLTLPSGRPIPKHDVEYLPEEEQTGICF